VSAQNQTQAKSSGAKARLLEAATILFAEKGYASTAVREIVEHAGVTKPVLYYYFKNKEGIFRAILEWAAELQGTLLAEVLETPGTVLDRMIYLYRRVYEGVHEHKDLFNLINNLVFGPPQGTPKYDYDAYHRRMVDAVRRIYEAGMTRGEVIDADPSDAAILVLSLLDFCLHMDRLRPKISGPERPERLLRLAFKGIARKDDT
jgi:TetR/AcrR family transcriptional regulator